MSEGERFTYKRRFDDGLPSTSSGNVLNLEVKNNHKKMKRDLSAETNKSILKPPIELSLPILQFLAKGCFKSYNLTATIIAEIHEYLLAFYPDGMPEFHALKKIIGMFALRAKKECSVKIIFKPSGIHIIPAPDEPVTLLPIIPSPKKDPEIALHIMYKSQSGRRCLPNRFRNVSSNQSQNIVDLINKIDEVSIENSFMQINKHFGLGSQTGTLEEKKRIIVANVIKETPVSFTYKIKNIHIVPRLHQNNIFVKVTDSCDADPMHILPPLFFNKQLDKSSDNSNDYATNQFSSEDSSDEEEDFTKMPLRRIYKSSASCYIDQGNPQKHFIEINDGRFMEDSPNTASYNCENVLTNKSSEVNIDARENNEDVIQTNTDKHVAKASTSLTKVTVNESAGYIGTQADPSKENSIEHIWDNSKNHILGNTVEQVRDESEIFSDNNSSGFARGDSIEYAQSVSVKCTKIVLKKKDNMFNKRKERKMKDLMEAITDLLNDIDEELEYSTSIESPGYNSEMEDSFTDSSNDKEVASESGSSSDDEEVASESRSSSDDEDPDNISDMEDSSDTSSEDTSNDSYTSNDSFNTSSEITANELTRIPFSSLYRQIFEEKILQNL